MKLFLHGCWKPWYLCYRSVLSLLLSSLRVSFPKRQTISRGLDFPIPSFRPCVCLILIGSSVFSHTSWNSLYRESWKILVVFFPFFPHFPLTLFLSLTWCPYTPWELDIRYQSNIFLFLLHNFSTWRRVSVILWDLSKDLVTFVLPTVVASYHQFSTPMAYSDGLECKVGTVSFQNTEMCLMNLGHGQRSKYSTFIIVIDKMS